MSEQAVESEAPTTLPPFVVPRALAVTAGMTWRILVIGLGIYILIWALFQIAPVALAIFLALFVTALAGPVARLFQRVLPKVVSVVLALLLITVVGGVIIFSVLRSIIEQGPALASAITAGIQDVEDWLQQGPLQLTGDQLNSVQQQAETWAKSAGESIASGLLSDLGEVGTIITAGSVFLFGTVFFMVSGPSIWQWLVDWVPVRVRDTFDTCGQLAWRTMAGYGRGMVVVALCDAFLVFIGLTILQVPLAPALAAVVFMGAFIPVIGAPIATFLAALVALATKGPVTALLVVALTIVVGSFDGDVMQPLVMGKAVSLHPLAIVTIIAAGALTFGVIGALIAIPIASSIYVILKYLTGRDPDHPYPRRPEMEPAPA
ncbi:MAG: AI-2E family transporter [Candidatus Nanopelagicales bacterium]